MDAPTRNAAIEKLDAITAEIGYPDWILDNALVDAFDADLKTAYMRTGTLLERIVKQKALVRALSLEMSETSENNDQMR